jgi:hypothetical protein
MVVGLGAAVSEGEGEGAAHGWRRRLNALSGKEKGRGEAGNGGTTGGRRGQGRRIGAPEVGDDPDRWAPPVGGPVREREGSGPRE